MKISIAMATYNGEKFIHQQLESFTTQTRLPDELIICDDKSSDNTIHIIEEFISTAPFTVKLYRNKNNRGVTKNFEQAIEKSTGDLIFISDQDDVWFPEKIAEIKELFEKNPEVWLVLNDREIVDEHLTSEGITSFLRYKQFGVDPFKINVGCCTTFRKKIKPYILPISPYSAGHDVWIHDVMSILGRKYAYPIVLQYYRRHSENVSTLFERKSEITHGLNSFLKPDPQPYLNDRQTLLEVKKRLQLHNILPTALKDRLELKIESFDARIDLMNAPFLSRKWKAFQLLRQGHYNNFAGYKSFFKDLII